MFYSIMYACIVKRNSIIAWCYYDIISVAVCLCVCLVSSFLFFAENTAATEHMFWHSLQTSMTDSLDMDTFHIACAAK